jgi:hypothetical protein
MNIIIRKIASVGVFALAAGSLVVAPSVTAADGSHLRLPCPAVDAEPICDLVPASPRTGSSGTEVTQRPEVTDTSTAGADWVADIGTGCHRVSFPHIVACAA